MNEPDMNSDACLPENIASPFLIGNEPYHSDFTGEGGRSPPHTEQNQDPTGEADRSPPKADSQNKPTAMGESSREAEHSPP